MNIGISVIICCYNSEKRIEKVLDCLDKQTGIQELNWEILVVDNASTDNTVRIVNDYCLQKKLPLKLIHEPKMGLSYARSAGIKTSKYEFICYIDDDNWINENYISTAYTIMINNRDVGLCGGWGTAVLETEPPMWFDEFQIAYAVGPQGSSSGYLQNTINRLYGAGMVLRRSAWEYLEKNGFAFKLTGRKGKALSSGEDSELSLALQLAGYKLWYEPALTFFHCLPAARLNYAYLKKLFKAFGSADSIIAIYHSYFNVYSKLKNMAIRNYFLCMIYNVYILIKLSYQYFFKSNSKIIRMKNHLNLIRGLSHFYDQIKLFGNYSRLVKSIGGSGWIKVANKFIL
jgi:glycosyltransferase involved in cell wall biosynthesis